MAVRLSNSVKRVTIIKKSNTGSSAQTVYDADDDDFDDDDGEIKFVVHNASGRRKEGSLLEDLGTPKKQSKRLRPMDRRIRKSVRNQMRILNRYMALHDRSSRKRKNGWARDFTKNIVKAVRKKS